MTETDTIDLVGDAPQGFDDALRTAPTDELEDLINELGPDARYDAEEAAAEVMRRHLAFVEDLAQRRGASTVTRRDAPDAAAGSPPPGAEASETRAPVRGVVSVIIGGETVELVVGTDVVIGRRGDHRVEHPRVSRRHVQIRVTPDGVLCQDLGSANGSWHVRSSERTPIEGVELPLIAGDRVVTVDDLELVRLPAAP